MNIRIRATIVVLIGATLLGSMGAWGRAVYRFEGDPMLVVTWRALIGVVVLAGILALSRPTLLRVPWSAIPFFLVYGFFGVTLNFWSYFSAVKHTTLAVAITLLYTYPMFVTLFSALWLGERLTRVKLAAAALTVLGAALVAQIHEAEFLRLNLRGILFGLLTGLSMAVYSILGKRAVARYAPWTVVLYAFAGGALFLVLGSGAWPSRGTRVPDRWLGLDRRPGADSQPRRLRAVHPGPAGSARQPGERDRHLGGRHRRPPGLAPLRRAPHPDATPRRRLGVHRHRLDPARQGLIASPGTGGYTEPQITPIAQISRIRSGYASARADASMFICVIRGICGFPEEVLQ